MTTAVLSTRVDRWIFATLAAHPDVIAAGVQNRIWTGNTAPDPGDLPYIRVQFISGVTTLGLNGTRILVPFIYLVEAVRKTGNWNQVEAVADAIYHALHQTRGSAVGVTVQSCICKDEVRREQAVVGVHWRYLGWWVHLEATAA